MKIGAPEAHGRGAAEGFLRDLCTLERYGDGAKASLTSPRCCSNKDGRTMSETSSTTRAQASADFDKARNRAFLQRVFSSLAGRPHDLLSYDDVRRKLHIVEMGAPRLEDVPLDKIIGSVGRYKDFTRTFLPRESHLKARWVKLNAAARGSIGFPPIEVFKVGDAYFVRDGNHRVSVLRQIGAPTVQAYVTEVTTRIPLDADTTESELPEFEECNRFLEITGLDRLRPEQNLRCSIPGRYRDLLEHISVHRYFMGIEQDREIPYEEAVASWYDNVYMPLVRVIREEHILRDFPHRTETDLYVWIIEHEYFLREKYGAKDIPDKEAAEHYAREFTEAPLRRLWRNVRRLFSFLRSSQDN